MSQNNTMAAFTWPNAAQGTASPGTMTSSSVTTSTAVDPGVFYSSDVAATTSTASDGGALFSSEVSTTTVTATSITTAVDPGTFYSSAVPTSTSTASDGGTFFSSDVPVSSTGCHQCTACTKTTSTASAHASASSFLKAVSNNPWNPNVAPPIDAVPSYIDYGTVSTLMPKATGVAIDRGTPFEMTDPMMPIADASSDLHSTFAKRDGPRFAKNPGHIIGVIILALGVVLVGFLAIKYCRGLIPTTHDPEKGNSRRYPQYEEVVRGRRRRRDGSPSTTHFADIPISEGYGMDPVDLARAQNWQNGFDEKVSPDAWNW